MSLIWLIAFVVFLVVEGVTTSLTSIWFAGGSLAALVVQVCGGGLYPQLAVFVAVSFMLFLMVRPFAYKYLYGKRTKTNVDSLTGRKAVVKDRIDNVAGPLPFLIMGRVRGPPFWPVRPGLPGRQRRGIPLKQVMWWLYPLSAGQSCW